MVYAVIKVTDGNYNIHAEGFTDKDKAIANFHALCSALWNDTETLSAECAVVDENLDVVEGHKEHIYHNTPTPSPYTEITDINAVAEEDVTYYVLINGEYVADTGVKVGDRVFGKYVKNESEG